MAAFADPKLVRNLQTQQGVGVKGLILISPVLDFREYSGSSILQYVNSLPSYAAVAREAKGDARGEGKSRLTRADLADVERYAGGEFLADLMKGQADAEATNRLADKVARLDRNRSGGQPQARPGASTSPNSAASSIAATAR